MLGDERPIRPAGQALLRAFAGEMPDGLEEPDEEEEAPHHLQVT
jgi:hypothetical protein